MGLTPLLTQVRKRLRRSRGRLRKNSAGFVTVGLVFTVIGAMALTLLGVGVVSRKLDVFDGAAWLSSSENGSAQRVNLDAGAVDMRYTLKDAKGHDVVIVQTDTVLLLHDRTAGTVTSINLSNLNESGRLDVEPGDNSSVVMWNDTVLLVNASQGQIRRLDPQDLTAQSKPLKLTPGLVPGGFDKEGRYWVASPKDGMASAVVTDKGSTKLRVEQEVSVAQPGHDLTMTTLDSGACIVDRTADTVVVVNNNEARSVRVPGLGSAIIAARTTSSVIAITVPDSRQVVLVENGKVRTITVKGEGPLGEAVVFAGRVYVVDTAGAVLALETSGELKRRIAISAQGTSVTMEQREGALLINEPGGSSGYVVDKNHDVKKVTKYTDSGTGPARDNIASNGPKKKAPTPDINPPRVRPEPGPAPSSGDKKPGDNVQQPETDAPSSEGSGQSPEPGQGPGSGQSPEPGQDNQRRAPNAPALENVRGGDGRITLSYYPPNDTGGAELTAIDIYCNNRRVIHDTNPGNGKQNVSFSAENGAPCTVQGYAINSEGSSAAAIGGTVTPESAAPTPTPTPPPTPTPTPMPPTTNNAVPTGVRASVAGPGQDFQVTWNAVSVPAGSRLDNYKVYVCAATGGFCVLATSSGGTSASVPNRGSDTGRTFRVTSVIDGKESARSAPSNVVQSSDPPGE